MTRSRPRARSPEDQERVRRRFVECARDVFAREGAHGLTMRRLASEAGYSPGTIYLYFPSRQELLREVWKEDLVALRHRMASALDDAGDEPRARVRALLAAYAQFWFDQPDHFRAMFLEADRQYVDERAAFAGDESVKQVHELLLREVGQAVESGALKGESSMVVAHALLGAIHGVCALHISNTGFPWADRGAMCATVLDNMLAGLSQG